MTVRERIDAMADKGSFHEIGKTAGGSVKSIEMAGRTYIPEIRGWDTVVNHLSR
ncbi:hypothetical protein [Candidatus Poriferisodalis sp.]|uniref:hypothetical protein n=1 Tax=Candidatus Poriferisodalis sp. TaxID=3101277 RepID=UPI003B01E8CD